MPPEVLQLLAEPIRWELLTELSRSDRRVGELCELLDKPQPLVSYHLRELRTAGLVTSRRSAADGRDTYYRGDVARCAELLSATGAALHPAVSFGPVDAGPPARRGPKRRLLFLCTGNSSRSQMAEALVQHRAGGAVIARSAGSHPKPVHEHAVRVMAERGIDISTNRSKHLERFVHDRFDRVITLCDKVREVCPGFDGEPVAAHWSMADPSAEGTYAAFERTADEIEERVSFLVAELTADHRNERKRP